MSDTKIDRQRHDASARHQQAIRSFINGLHKQNRDQARDDRLAKEALRDIEKQVKASGKSFSTGSPSSSTTTTSSTTKISSIPKPPKPAADSSNVEPSGPAVIFEKKAKEKKQDPDLATWSFKEKEAKPVDTDLSSIDLLKDDSAEPDKPPKRSVFKKRSIKVSKS